MFVNICKGITLKGLRCTKQSISGREYCHLHYTQDKNIFKQEKPNECPICCEQMNEKKPKSCGHWIHNECIINSGKQECPLCRKKIILTQQAVKKLKEIATRHHKEKIEEETEELMNEYDDEPDFIIINSPIDDIIMDIIDENVAGAEVDTNNIDLEALLNNILNDIMASPDFQELIENIDNLIPNMNKDEN